MSNVILTDLVILVLRVSKRSRRTIESFPTNVIGGRETLTNISGRVRKSKMVPASAPWKAGSRATSVVPGEYFVRPVTIGRQRRLQDTMPPMPEQ